MSSIPGSMFVAPGSCHTSLRKYHQIQKRQQSQEMVIPPGRENVDGGPKALPASPIGSPVGSPVPPMSPLNKMCKYFRQFSNPGATGIQEFHVPNVQTEMKPPGLQGAMHGAFDFPPQGTDTTTPEQNTPLTSPLTSPRSDSGDA